MTVLRIRFGLCLENQNWMNNMKNMGEFASKVVQLCRGTGIRVINLISHKSISYCFLPSTDASQCYVSYTVPAKCTE